jgi:hypothetical protein
MDATDNTHLIPAFWKKINQMDGIRHENFLDSIIEIIDIR